ncbi:MAG: restriction endonuclease subunit S [bacterium]
MSKYPERELGEIAEVFVGVARHGRGLSWDENNPTAPLLGMKALRQQGIDFNAIEIVHLSPRTNLENYRIAAHDLLLPCRGTDLRIIVAPEKAGGVLIDSNIMAIRCGPLMAHQLLAAYFQHSAGQAALLRASQSTTSQKNLTVRLVKKMAIPVPPPEAQQKAVAVLEAAERQHQLALQVAEKRLTLARHAAINMLVAE